MNAVLNNDIDKIKELVKKEDVNYINTYDETAVYYACKNNNLDALKILYEAGAVVEYKLCDPIRIAAKNGHIGIVKYLVYTCNVNLDRARGILDNDAFVATIV
jgi:ankyrin repeat protein